MQLSRIVSNSVAKPVILQFCSCTFERWQSIGCKHYNRLDSTR